MLSHDFPPYNSGGANSTSFLRYARKLHDSGFDVTVVAGRSASKLFLENKDFKVFRVHFLDLPPRALWFQIENRKFVLKLASESDVVFAYYRSSGLLSKEIVSMGIPLVVKIGGSPITDMQNYSNLPLEYQSLFQTFYYLGELPLLTYLVKNDLLYSTHLIFDSYYMLEEIERQFKIRVRDKSTVVHNTLTDSLSKTGFSAEIKNHIIFVGRLYGVKGIMELIYAFAELHKEERYRSWKLIIVGDGPLKSRIQRVIRDFNLFENVVLLGRIPHEKVLQEETAAKIFVHPSHIESNSNSVAEAMSLGLPIIVPRLPWAVEQTEGYDNKLFFSAWDPKSLANTIMDMISSSPDRKPLKLVSHDQDIVDVFREIIADLPVGTKSIPTNSMNAK